MFGHDWRSGEATIVDVHIKSVSGDGRVVTREFAADVRSKDKAWFRATIQEPTIATDFWPPGSGDVVQVLFDPNTHKVKFDKSDPKISARAQERAAKERFAATAAAGVRLASKTRSSGRRLTPNLSRR